MIVCDICRKSKFVKSYTLPMRGVYHELYQGEKIGSFIRYEDKNVDLCQSCAESIADLIDRLQIIHQKEN